MYDVPRWGKGYFSINAQGHLRVHPMKDPNLGIDLKDLIDRLHRHMRTEETTLFPAARSSLTSTDWANIALVLGAPDDPLFGPRCAEPTTGSLQT